MTSVHVSTRTPGRLIGVGHYFPGPPIPNAYFEEHTALEVDDTWIVEHTGVHSRHWADVKEMRHVEMAAVAARHALADAGLDAGDVDLIIGTTATSRPRVNPSSTGNRYMDIAPPLQASLEADKAACFDITAVACAGFLHSSTAACAMLHALGLDVALVVTAENPVPVLNFDYRNSVLFGAGAAAAVWRRSDLGSSGLFGTVLGSDGRYFSAFDIDDDDKMIMRGSAVDAIGSDLLAEGARTVMRRTGLSQDDIAWFVPHQGNINMIEKTGAALGLPEEKILTNIDRRGNTSSVGVPSCLSENIAAGVVRPGDIVLSSAIGRGVSWGAMLYTYR